MEMDEELDPRIQVRFNIKTGNKREKEITKKKDNISNPYRIPINSRVEKPNLYKIKIVK